MMAKYTPGDLEISPYYDRFDDTSNITFVAFVANNILQGSEMNELQSIISYYMQSLGNSIMSDGDKQAGMAYVQDGTNITIQSGEVYLGGKVRHFLEQTVKITGVGIENIGIKLNTEIITPQEDSSLLNPAIGAPGYQSQGANRIRETVELVANDSSAVSIYTFKDGKIYYVPESTQLAKVSNMMAKQTSEIDGNFRIGSSGFQMSTVEDPNDNKKAILNISSGVAYILGKRVNKAVATQLSVDRAINTSTITNEQNTFATGTLKYPLGNYPVQDISTVTANVQKTIVVSRGTSDVDSLADKNVISISKVYTEGSSSVTYTENTDYKLINHQTIQWISTGSSPASGTSYKVTYVYNKSLDSTNDYAVTTDEDSLITSIDFTGKGIVGSGDATGGVLFNGSIISTTYDYYLARIDILTLNDKGDFIIHVGQPNDADSVVPPLINDGNVLEIGSIAWLPNSYKSTCKTYATSNLTFRDLTMLRDRVDIIEFNEALNSLDDVATANYDPTQLRGVFSDGFISLDKADYTNDDYSVMMNFEDGTITLQYSSKTELVPDILSGESNIILSDSGKFATAAYTEVPAISQPTATSAILINEYSYFGKEGVLTLKPSSDNWVTNAS